MTRALGTVLVLLYVVLSFAILAIWLPNFFAVNTTYTPELSWRYIAASGLPFGLLLVTVISRQAFIGFFSIGMLFQVLVAAAMLYAGLYAFYVPTQSNFFCMAHLVVCAIALLLNMLAHRKELKRFQSASKPQVAA